MKKVLALLVALTLCVSIVGLFASCSKKTVVEATKWNFTNITKDGKIIGCSVTPGSLFKVETKTETDEEGNTTKVTLPVEIPSNSEEDGTGVPVITIGRDAFQLKTSIEEVIVPASVTTIENYAFAGCTSLKKVTADNLQTIGRYAFRHI